MARLEDLTHGTYVEGLVPGQVVTIIDAKWHGANVLEVTYKDAGGSRDSELLYRDDEPRLGLAQQGRPWSYDGDPAAFRLASEACRIHLAHLFDPLLAVHTSLVDPLPHQITGVYEEMLPRQPLRFLLADDPGAGKTIMAGLLIKELMARGDLRRCLVVCPGALSEQWQDELWRRFGLPFELMTNDKLEASRTGNWFADPQSDLAICRLDKLSRDDDCKAKLEQSDWDLIVVDEAHKMSATHFSNEVKYTKRHRLGQLLSARTRHFLLLTATPHNGKEADFQLFMSLLDGDRFEGRFRDGVHTADVSDLMRRMVKEELLKFDGTHLFPERKAYTVKYKLSDGEAALYSEVTTYVREEFNRAEALQNDKRAGTVGFALTILQRRLASSPEAICQSLRRRRERLEKWLREEKLLQRGAIIAFPRDQPLYTDEDLEDLEDAPDQEVENAESEVVNQATAAQTIEELQAEIATLRRLEALAQTVRNSGTDRKWEELSDLLQGDIGIVANVERPQKLIVFTEHRDTLSYLVERIGTFIGNPEAVVVIHGGMGREQRRNAQESFVQDKNVQILVATDAASEGINLQRANLMVNYDLPWNPNRLEQRFGRIHRIGQTEVCHMWSLVAEETREGDVYARLLEKLEQQRQTLGGSVFDILGKLFRERSLRQLLVEAIRYGDQPEVRNRLFEVVDNVTDRERCRELIEERALVRDTMDISKVRQIREDMERAEARRLQPRFISSFFREAFTHLGGSLHEREPGRYEATHVPAAIRSRDRQIGTMDAVLPRYERIAFDKECISVQGKPIAEFVCPGYPLLDATLDIILERYRGLLRQGTVLIDEEDDGNVARALCYLEHEIRDARVDTNGQRRTVSKQMHFVEIEADGNVRNAGYAPYLDYRPPTPEEATLIEPILDDVWLSDEIENRAIAHAASDIVPEHLAEVRTGREELIDITLAAVKERLTKEIVYWDHRARQLREQEAAGKQPKMNSQQARRRADELEVRLSNRLAELKQERQISSRPPIVVGGALIVPIGLLAQLQGQTAEAPGSSVQNRRRVEAIAMQAVMHAERRLGYDPFDVSSENRGYDIESHMPNEGHLRMIEVKGRAVGAGTVTITRNEILTALNKPADFILALVQVEGDSAAEVSYIRQPFGQEPEFGVTSINYNLSELLANSQMPS